MNKHTIVGIDLAKNIFQVATLNHHRKITQNQPLKRDQLLSFIAQLPPCLIAMEACGSAHYWARQAQATGHHVKLIPPTFVKGFVTGNKNDANDAKAIAIAASHHESPTAQVKSPQQLAFQATLRVRQRRVDQRTACANQIRGLLAEHGVILPIGLHQIRNLDTDTLPQPIRNLISSVIEEFKLAEHYLRIIDQQIQQLILSHPVARRLNTIPGFGPLNILAALTLCPEDFRNGRHYAAYLGLVPKQNGTGGKIRLLGISKRGNPYHRQLLCHGARAALCRSNRPNDNLILWARRIQARKGTNVAVTALANKLARISWAVINDGTYAPDKAAANPIRQKTMSPS